MVSEGLTALPHKKAFVGGIKENNSEKVWSKCSSWPAEEVPKIWTSSFDVF